MTDAVVLSSFQHGRTLFVRGQFAQFDPRTFVELEANGLVREKTAADVEPKPAPAPVSRPPARSRAVKPAPSLDKKPVAADGEHIVVQFIDQKEPLLIPVAADPLPQPPVGPADAADA